MIVEGEVEVGPVVGDELAMKSTLPDDGVGQRGSTEDAEKGATAHGWKVGHFPRHATVATVSCVEGGSLRRGGVAV